MTDKPILFSAPMVCALLDGRKTQTRRVLTMRNGIIRDRSDANDCVRLFPGDRLWVKETWRPIYLGDGIWDLDITYAADGMRRRINDGEFGEGDWNWPKAADRGNVSPLFMPRWASRLTLTVTDVRVQRLQDVSEADAVAEGGDPAQVRMYPELGTCRHWFEDLWNSLHGADAWDANPWVMAVTFTVAHCNIDQMEAPNA